MNEAPVAAQRAGRREWIGLTVLALACLLYAMDLTVLHLAVPQISADLRPSSAQLLWIIDIYGFMVAGFLITMGTLGDRIGRRRLLLIGAAAFGEIDIPRASMMLAQASGRLIRSSTDRGVVAVDGDPGAAAQGGILPLEGDQPAVVVEKGMGLGALRGDIEALIAGRDRQPRLGFGARRAEAGVRARGPLHRRACAGPACGDRPKPPPARRGRAA